MAYVQRHFIPDIPGSIVVPAHEDNVRPGDNHPKVSVVHTPEERADGTEVTPFYFARRIYDANGNQVRASTHFYTSGGLGTLGNGDLYQMVPERYGAIANGVTRDRSYPADTNPSISLNLQSRSNELEGYAHNIHQTMPRGSPQWLTTVKWCLSGYYDHDIPIDRAHILGHYEVSNVRTDPGTLNIDDIVEDASRLLEKEEEPDDMTTYKLFNTWGPARMWLIQYVEGVPIYRRWILTRAGADHLISKLGEPETIDEHQLRSIPVL